MSLALSTKATLDGWPKGGGQYKVVDLGDFAAGHMSFERSVLDLRGIPIADHAQLTSLPWSGFLVDSAEQVPEGRPWIQLHGVPETAKTGDVIETQPLIGKIAVHYRRGANGNMLFATERCDNYCLMCSQPPRQVADEWRLGRLLELVELIDRNEPSLAISGGEPTLLGDGLVDLIEKCAEQLPETGVHVLSNGRAFRDAVYATRFTGINSRLSWGIPLYGDHFALHDYVVQRAGAFAETLRGRGVADGLDADSQRSTYLTVGAPRGRRARYEALGWSQELLGCVQCSKVLLGALRVLFEEERQNVGFGLSRRGEASKLHANPRHESPLQVDMRSEAELASQT